MANISITNDLIKIKKGNVLYEDEYDNSILREIRNEVLELSHQKFIFTRPVWRLLNKQKPYIYSPKGDLSNSEFMEFRIISLPSSTKINP